MLPDRLAYSRPGSWVALTSLTRNFSRAAKLPNSVTLRQSDIGCIISYALWPLRTAKTSPPSLINENWSRRLKYPRDRSSWVISPTSDAYPRQMSSCSSIWRSRIPGHDANSRYLAVRVIPAYLFQISPVIYMAWIHVCTYMSCKTLFFFRHSVAHHYDCQVDGKRNETSYGRVVISRILSTTNREFHQYRTE